MVTIILDLSMTLWKLSGTVTKWSRKTPRHYFKHFYMLLSLHRKFWYKTTNCKRTDISFLDYFIHWLAIGIPRFKILFALLQIFIEVLALSVGVKINKTNPLCVIFIRAMWVHKTMQFKWKASNLASFQKRGHLRNGSLILEEHLISSSCSVLWPQL